MVGGEFEVPGVLGVPGSLPVGTLELFDPLLHAARAQAVATTRMRRNDVTCFMPVSALQQPQVTRIGRQDREVPEGGTVQATRGLHRPVPATPLSWEIPRTGGFASLPFSRFAFNKNRAADYDQLTAVYNPVTVAIRRL